MKKTKIKITILLFLIALIFSHSYAAGSDIIKYICDDKSIMLLNEKNGYIRCYKVNEDINYLLIDKLQSDNINLTDKNISAATESKEARYITLLMPAKKKLLIDFNRDYTAPQVSSGGAVKNIDFINNDCVSFLDLYQKIISISAINHSFNTVNDSIICCNSLMSETLMALKNNNTLLFLPILIPAITKLEKNRTLLPLAYIDSILFDPEDINELIINFIIVKIHDKSSPDQEFLQYDYLKIITSKLPRDRAKYKINLSTKNSIFDLITCDNFSVNLKEELLSQNQ